MQYVSWQRSQPLEGGTCREEEIQSLAIQTTGMCANNGIEMVYQCLSASDGDVSTNSEVVGGRISELVNSKFGDTIWE